MPPLDQAGALLSSPVAAGHGAVTGNCRPVQFRGGGQYCSLCKIVRKKKRPDSRKVAAYAARQATSWVAVFSGSNVADDADNEVASWPNVVQSIASP
jgi:hypothetical protein